MRRLAWAAVLVASALFAEERPVVPYQWSEHSQKLALDPATDQGRGDWFGITAVTDACELVRSPEYLKNRPIRIRAHIHFESETFSIRAFGCSGMIDEIWLEYGSGNAVDPTPYCCGEHPRDPRYRLKVDRAFRKFHSYLTEQGVKYVTATLTGQFEYAPGGAIYGPLTCSLNGGYGHFGKFCARLIITQISDPSK